MNLLGGDARTDLQDVVHGGLPQQLHGTDCSELLHQCLPETCVQKADRTRLDRWSCPAVVELYGESVVVMMVKTSRHL